MHGVAQLGYLIFGVRDLAAWESFMTGVLAMCYRFPNRLFSRSTSKNSGSQ